MRENQRFHSRNRSLTAGEIRNAMLSYHHVGRRLVSRERVGVSFLRETTSLGRRELGAAAAGLEVAEAAIGNLTDGSARD
jgi:hypothetical protein